MRVEIIVALPTEQVAWEVRLAEGATVMEAIRASGVLERFPEIDLAQVAVGVFGERVTLEHPLEEDDRVEIYRGLVADPKEARRRRARKRK